MRLAVSIPCALACASLACAAPFRAGTPVEIERHWYGTLYKQDGKQVDPFSVASGLEAVDASRADAATARTHMVTGMVLGVAGGVASGLALGQALNGSCSKGCAAVGLAGVGAIAVAAAVDRSGRDRLDRAIGAYNGGPRAGARPSLAPWATVTPAARERCVVGGLAIAF